MVKLNKIYTKTGDDGTTGLVDGSRIAKNDPRMAAIGDVDELNSALGVAICEITDEALVQTLRIIQNDLFDLGADLATPPVDGDDFSPSEMILRVVPSQVERLEKAIDAATAELNPLTSFILPGGCGHSSCPGCCPADRAYLCRRWQRHVHQPSGAGLC
jgi:cob(I)alamin adenosyltransferase